ncbi:VTT domain-containing protein [Paenibacillus sp. SYP-B3998]|nr:VTT domain-containing protein [Paenibacillus sp. SYP-B3998]
MDLLFDLDKLVDWLKSFGVWAILVSIVLNVAISIIGVVPSILLSGANAAVFGMVPGFFISLIGEVIGAWISFVFYRWGIGKASRLDTEKWKWVQRINNAGRVRSLFLLFVARLTPIPSVVITLAAAFSNVRVLDFIVVTFLGKAPSVAMETLIGHDLLFLSGNVPRLIISLAFLLLIWIFVRTTQKQR